MVCVLCKVTTLAYPLSINVITAQLTADIFRLL